MLARLGQSRLAVIYRAQDERLQRAVLVHMLRQELTAQTVLRERFLDEARRGAQRSHPGLLEVYDSGDIGGRPYLVTEDIAGQPLSDRVPLPLAEALGVLRTVASAVALAESQGAPHPPVSSCNVWLLDGGRAVLLENWLMSPPDVALDLANYRAPERVAGAPPSPATTVYALGILSWETIAGKRPFSGSTPQAIVARQQREPLQSLSDVDPRLFAPGLDRVIMGAAAADPNLRYPAPVDFGRALDLYVDQATAQTGRLAILQRPQPSPRTGVGRVFRRRGDTAVGHAVQLPPPPPVLREQPRIARRPAAPPPLQPAPAATLVDGQSIDAQAQRAARKRTRRQGCQRALVKRSIQLALIVAVIYGVLVGFEYATGRVRQLDPAAWIAERLPEVPALPQLPDLSALRRLIDVGQGIAGGGNEAASLVVTQPINLREGPTTATEPLRQLPEGTVLRRIEGPVDDPTGLSLTWIKVVVVEDGTEGWVAYQPARLREQ